ncbi:hypothetical protein ACFXJ6_32240 [Streptomyces sp. NPDC059218]|uniref:hypothetical protein n=1 Tax=unclassified Streptomyces TaxID=2593676 RepID=UPI0036A4A725
MTGPAALVGDVDAILALRRPTEARPMRRECPVQAIGTPARVEMRLMARVTESGPMPPVMWPHWSMSTKAGADASAHFRPCSRRSPDQRTVKATAATSTGASAVSTSGRTRARIAAPAALDPVETPWMGAGPDRLTITRNGVIVHQGRHTLARPDTAEPRITTAVGGGAIGWAAVQEREYTPAEMCTLEQ